MVSLSNRARDRARRTRDREASAPNEQGGDLPGQAHDRRNRPSGPRAAPDRRGRADPGRLVMVPGAAVLLFLDAVTLARGGVGRDAVLRWAGAAEVCVFYTLVIWCYLRRRPAVATSTSVTAHIAAVAATLAPLAVPLLNGPVPGAARQATADAVLVAGTAWSLWSLRSLGRNVSVIAQARELVEHGPYRWIRHPLYTGEITSAAGLAIAAGTAPAVVAWLVLCGLQGYRAMREEQVLLGALPGYRGYQRRTAALLPGVF